MSLNISQFYEEWYLTDITILNTLFGHGGQRGQGSRGGPFGQGGPGGSGGSGGLLRQNSQ